jgi:tRNA (mo5U34)-methyltransferase
MSDFHIDFEPLYQAMSSENLQPWLQVLPQQINHVLYEKKHGDLQRWQQALSALPAITPSTYDLNSGRVRVGEATDVDAATRDIIKQQLMQLSPWRKGPYEFFGVHVDTEWRSDWKWDRIKDHIQPLAGRTVLDVGGGNGYHSWRMAGAGAELVINVDPSKLFLMQYQALRHYLGDIGVYVLPLGIDDVPRKLKAFDSVFSMGVLYHRRSPLDHILHLRECLRPGGQLILETLIVEGDENTVLMPEDRYAQMNNVWFIPSCAMLHRWLRRAGLKDIHIVDVTETTTAEQRSTEWMQFQSLSDFLNPLDTKQTIEGYPAPRRALVTALSPD